MAETLSPPQEGIGENQSTFEQEASQHVSDYLSEFERSINFNPDQRLQLYLAEHPDQEISDDDRKLFVDTLRTGEGYKQQLWLWRNEHRLEADVKHFPQPVRSLIYEYWATIDHIKNNRPTDKDEIRNLDLRRNLEHFAAAKELVNLGLAPNETIGRLLIHFISIEEGFDVIDPERDIRRLQGYS
jgi:hypothetical protein